MTCPSGKTAHATREAALDHIKRLVWKNHCAGESHRSAGLGVYPCASCGRWHVGHSQGSPLVYHYTVGYHLEPILASDKLKVRRAKARKRRGRAVRALEPQPLLWFSRNPDWERSVVKLPVAVYGEQASYRSVTEMAGDGLVRFLVPSALATLRWSDYLTRNAVTPDERDAMAQFGNPVEWLATDEDVPLDLVKGVEVYYGERGWVPASAVEPDAFDAYLAGRQAVYTAAKDSLLVKFDEAEARKVADRVEAIRPLCNEAERILLEDFDQRFKVTMWSREYQRKRAGRIHADL